MASPFFTNTAATTAAVTNRFVTTVNMKVGTYTIANASPVWSGGCLVTLTHTSVDTTDTLGTVTIVGKGLNGAVITEVLTPVADSTVTSVNIFRSITSATGAGWVKGGTTEDTIVIGCAAGSYASGSSGVLEEVIVNTTAAAAVVISDKTGTIATLKSSIAEGSYLFNVVYNGFLKVATTSTNDVTVTHSGTLPAYATA